MVCVKLIYTVGVYEFVTENKLVVTFPLIYQSSILVYELLKTVIDDYIIGVGVIKTNQNQLRLL